jgi:F-type H+-transporting ATPase subunit delta
MRHGILAARYAKALYQLAKETNSQDGVFSEMRALQQAFAEDKQVAEFIDSPVVRPSQKEQAIKVLCEKVKLSGALMNFVLLLAKKNRLNIFSAIVEAYEIFADEAHGVTRGTVRSAAVLDPAERKQVEEFVGRATGKQVILNYKEDPSLLGGLVAQVGSFTFDDSLNAHLIRINEQLTRSVH